METPEHHLNDLLRLYGGVQLARELIQYLSVVL